MIEVTYTNGVKLFINLFDIPIVDKIISTYKGHFENTYFSLLFSMQDGKLIDYEGRLQSEKEINKYWKLILDGLAGMEQVGNKIDKDYPNKFDFSQNTLNELHRIFTFTDLYEFNEISDYPFSKNYSKNYGISFEEYHHIVDKINQGVHNLERWTYPTDNKIFLENQNLQRIEFHPCDYSTFEMKWCEFNAEEYRHNFELFSYDYENLVTLRDTILGKSIMASFRDDDNPTQPDCTGRFATDGSFQINRGYQLQNFYKSDKFVNWLSKHNKNLHSSPLEFAIGYVDVEKTTEPIEYFFSNELKIEKLIWNKE